MRNTTFSPEFYSFGEVPPRTKFDALSSCMDFFYRPGFFRECGRRQRYRFGVDAEREREKEREGWMEIY